MDPFTSWSRLITAAFDMVTAGQRVGETASASHEVIAVRAGMMRLAMGSPLDGNYAELGRMVPEKVEAFALAGTAVMSGWWAMQAAFMAEAQHVGAMMMRGRPPTAGEVSVLANRSMSHALRTVERTVELTSAAVTPIHRSATANARRLKHAA